jgi:SpoVK/Ycf46/Vps4 family AAA+-type ATPase
MSNPGNPESQGPQDEGIVFVIRNEELISQAIIEGQSGKLAHSLLESPLQDFEMELQSDGDTFDISCEWATQFEARYGSDGLGGNFKPKNAIRLVKDRISNEQEVIERGGRFIFEGPRGTSFVLGEGMVGLDRVKLTTGKVRELLDDIQVVPSPAANKHNVSNVVSDTIEVAKMITDTFYEVEGKKATSQTIEVTPPRRTVRGVGRAAVAGVEGLQDKIEVERPNVTFEEIGGQETAKQEIEGLSFALSNPELYKKWGTKPPKGILLYGPPGTGKTLMAKALASQAEARFLHVKASDIGSKWYGESEQIVQMIFDLASQGTGKTIIYFDEIDSIVPSRGNNTHEATQKVIGTLLQNIDGMGSNDNVMIVASTNRREGIDSAMLRPGRLDRLVEVPLPDEKGRESIFSIHMQKAQKVAGESNKLFNGIDLEEIAKQTEGYSGADVAEIIRRVLEAKVRLEGKGQEPGIVTIKDFMYQIHNYERTRQASQTTPGTGQYL